MRSSFSVPFPLGLTKWTMYLFILHWLHGWFLETFILFSSCELFSPANPNYPLAVFSFFCPHRFCSFPSVSRSDALACHGVTIPLIKWSNWERARITTSLLLRSAADCSLFRGTRRVTRRPGPVVDAKAVVRSKPCPRSKWNDSEVHSLVTWSSASGVKWLQLAIIPLCDRGQQYGSFCNH